MHMMSAISLVASGLFTASFACAQTPTAPPQPTSGPGGSDYLFTEVQTYGPFTTESESGNTDTYYIYQPAGPVPASAPAVLFLHGFGADTPQSYQLWIDHMVKMGYTVVWALFDTQAASTFVNYAASDWTQALDRIARTPGMVPVSTGPNGEKMTAAVGHSAGAFTSFALADLLAQYPALPHFRTIIAIEPGQGQIPNYDLSAIDARAGIVIVVGDQDKASRRCEASQIWQALPPATGNSRNFLEVVSDTLGTPQQLGNHYFSLTETDKDTVPPPISVDDRDYNVSWKLSVAALGCAMSGTYCEIAFGQGDSQQITMGFWSDGIPVTPLLYVTDPVTQFEPDCVKSGRTGNEPGPDRFESLN